MSFDGLATAAALSAVKATADAALTPSATNSLAATLRGEIAAATPADYASVKSKAETALQPAATNGLVRTTYPKRSLSSADAERVLSGETQTFPCSCKSGGECKCAPCACPVAAAQAAHSKEILDDGAAAAPEAAK